MDISDFESSGMLGDVPEAFRRYLGLEPLESLVHTLGAQGATRLFTCASFDPVEVTTILYLDNTVKVSTAISDDDVWERISCGDYLSVVSEPSQVFRELAGSDLPPEFQNWERVADVLRGAESCMSDNPDGIPYYHILEDKWDLSYYVPASHLRVIPPNEISLISPDVPSYEKRIEVHTSTQIVIAYEYNQPVFMTRASTGGNFKIDGSYETPRGHHITNHKRPSRHMAAGNLAFNGYDLPGVPWIMYITESGIAFHGTYWHNDFGKARSHGCINLPSKAAKWFYRWTHPQVPYHMQSTYNVYGTHVDIL